MQIAFLGLGLISGSLARAVRSPGSVRAVAWTPSGAGPRAALAAGIVDAAAATMELAIAGADLVVLGAPPSACLELIDALGAARGSLAADAVITDVASTKAEIVARARRHALRFVGGHPMAGREASGFGAADAALFRDRPWAIVPGAADEAAVARVEAVARAAGAHPIRMTAEDHDAAVAAISHLPLLAAVALVESVAGGPQEPPADGWELAALLAASGWRDMTRLARGDAAMGAGIAVTNAGPLADRLRAYRARLDAWIALLEPGPDAARRDHGEAGGPDADALRDRLAAARARLEAFDRSSSRSS